MKHKPEADHEFVENVPYLEIPPVALLPTNSKVIFRPCQIPLDIPPQIYLFNIPRPYLVLDVINSLKSLMYLFL